MHTSGAGALLQKSGFVDHEYSVTFAEVFYGVGAHVVADPVGVPGCGVEQALHAVRGQLASGLGQDPAVLARQRRQQATHVGTSPAARLSPKEPACDLREQVIQASDPRLKILIGQHKIGKLHHHDHEVLLEYQAIFATSSKQASATVIDTPAVYRPSYVEEWRRQQPATTTNHQLKGGATAKMQVSESTAQTYDL